MQVQSKDCCIFSLCVCLYFSILWVHFFCEDSSQLLRSAIVPRHISDVTRASRVESRRRQATRVSRRASGQAPLLDSNPLQRLEKHNKAKLLARWAAVVATAAGTAADSCNQITCKHCHMSLARRLRCRPNLFCVWNYALSWVEDGRRFLSVEM